MPVLFTIPLRCSFGGTSVMTQGSPSRATSTPNLDRQRWLETTEEAGAKTGWRVQALRSVAFGWKRLSRTVRGWLSQQTSVALDLGALHMETESAVSRTVALVQSGPG